GSDRIGSDRGDGVGGDVPRDKEGDPHLYPGAVLRCMPNANPEPQRSPAHRSGTTEMAARKATALNVIARETHEMSALALLTPTYARDLEICRLLCESVDRHVKSFSRHYLLVPDRDVALFAPLAS